MSWSLNLLRSMSASIFSNCSFLIACVRSRRAFWMTRDTPALSRCSALLLGQYAGQPQSQDQEQARKNQLPGRTTGASAGLQGNNDLGLRFNMAAPQSGDNKQQITRSQQPSVDFGAGGNTLGTFQFNASVNQGNDASMLFTGNDSMSMQQFQQNQGLFEDSDTFNLDTAFDSSYGPTMDSMTAFQQNYSNPGDFQGNDMAFSLGYDTPTDAQSQPLSALFTNSTFVSLPQTSIQPTTSPEQLTTQHNWVDMSNFNLSLPGQRMSDASAVGGLTPQQSSLVTLPRRSQSSGQSQSISPFTNRPPSKPSNSPPTFSNPFIPSGITLTKTYLSINFSKTVLIMLSRSRRFNSAKAGSRQSCVRIL